MNYEEQKSFALKAVAFILTVEIVIGISYPAAFILEGFQDHIVMLGWTFYSFVNILKSLYFAQLIFACLAVRKRFQALNKYLENSFQSNIVSAKNSISWQFSKVYHEICDVDDIINGGFTFHFIFLFACLLVRFPCQPLTAYSY